MEGAHGDSLMGSKGVSLVSEVIKILFSPRARRSFVKYPAIKERHFRLFSRRPRDAKRTREAKVLPFEAFYLRSL